MSLDRRARHAARSLQDSVRRVTPAGMAVVARRHRFSLVAGLAGALVVAFASISLAAILPGGPSDEGATVLPTIPEVTSTTPTVAPDGSAEVEGSAQQVNASTDGPEAYSRFFGTGRPGSAVSAYSAYGTADAVVGASGEFSLKVRFAGAPLGITFPVTVSVNGQEFEFGFTWLWDPASVAITAHQTYGTSDSETPYEKFFGTAPPGTAITASSAYGTAQGQAGDLGTWHLKLWFQAPPFGEAFDVTVVVGDQAFTFPFVWLREPTVEVGVNQQGTSSTSSSPYTRFYGTAPAGTHVLATSSYGSADLEVGASGEFSFKVWFANAPAGVKFPITVKVDQEYYGTFYFTSYWSPSQAQFTLTQYNTESWDAAPWVKFYGTAQPGTHLLAISDYGSADLEVGASGEYYLKLHFATLPPAGQQFQVTVKVNGAYYGTYPFTSWFDGVVDLTVNQYNTESWDAAPWVKFYGTAPIGTQIEIISDYGAVSATTTSVNWLTKLWFSTLPPAGQQFQVTLKVNGEYYGTYPFTSWYQASVEKTAHFTYGSCSANPPYDVYYGTAPAGTAVMISSDFGSGAATANASGNWEQQVFFAGAPLNQAFTVTVDVGGVLFYFPMLVIG